MMTRGIVKDWRWVAQRDQYEVCSYICKSVPYRAQVPGGLLEKSEQRIPPMPLAREHGMLRVK